MLTKVNEILKVFDNTGKFKNWKSEEAKKERQKFSTLLKRLTASELQNFKEVRQQQITEYLKGLKPLKSEQLILDKEDIKNYY